MKNHERIVLTKIDAYAKQAIEFKKGMDFDAFSDDAKTIAACAQNLSQIGELAGKLDDSFVNEYSKVPWRKIRGMRNRIVHDYEGLNLNIIWDVLEDFLPNLIDEIDNYLEG